MFDAKPSCTLMKSGKALSFHTGTLLPPKEAIKFRQCCGSLQYASITRPDISFTVNKLC